VSIGKPNLYARLTGAILASASYRVYAANKMYHMGAPLNVLTSNRAEYENLIAEYKASQKTLDQLQKSGKKNSVARRNAENNIKVGELLEQDLPKIEEAEAVCDSKFFADQWY
jgi:hypothetical protein